MKISIDTDVHQIPVIVGSLFTCPSAGPPQQPFFLFCTLARASFESIRPQDTGRQAFERGGQTPSTHLGRCRTVSLRPRELEPADRRDRRRARASTLDDQEAG